MPWVEIAKAAAPATTITLGPTWAPFAADPIDAVGGEQQVFLAVAALNGGLNTPTFSIDVPPGETATWQRITQARGNSTSGVRGRGDIFAIIPTIDWNNFSPTITIASAPAAANPPGWADWLVMEGGSITPRALDTWVPYLNGGAGESPPSHTISGSGQPRAGDLCIGFSTNRAAAIPALDPDITNGSWVSVGAADTGGATAIQARLQYKIVTARGDQTLDPANAQNTVMGCLIAQEDFTVSQQGGDIDPVSADPRWLFSTATVPVAPNDYIYGACCFKRWDATSTTPAGYTKDETLASGTVNSGGSQTGSVRGEAFHKVADGSEGANVVVGLTGVVTLGVGALIRLKTRWTSAQATWLTDSCVGADTDMTGTAIAVTASSSIDCRPGDRIFWSLSVVPNGLPTSIVPSFPGLTGVNYQIQTASTITDPDARIVSGYFEVDTGSGATTPSLTAVSPVSGISQAVVTFTRVRSVIIPLPPIITDCDSPAEDQLTFTWVDGGFDAERYEVRIDGGAWSSVGLLLTHTFTGLAEGSTHTLEVRACNEGGCSAADSVACTTLSGVPTNLVVTPTDTTLELCFDAAAGSPDYYEVRIDGGAPVNIGTDLCHLFVDLACNTTYTLEARACIDDVGCSEWASIDGLTIPCPPTDLVVTATSESLNLCWDAPTNGADYYEVRIDAGAPVSNAADLCHLFSGLSSNSTYPLEVRACNASGCSDWVAIEGTTLAGRGWSPCACNPRWMVEVCQLATGQIRGVLSPTSIDIQQLLNGLNTGGSLTLPTRNVRIRDVWPDLTSVYISRLNDAGVMEGIGGFTIEAFDGRSTLQGGTVTLGLKTIEQYLLHRLLRQTLTYAGQPQTAIAASLVNYALTNGIPLTGVADVSAHYRDRTYDAAERPYIGELINQLVQVANGPEWVSLHTRAGGAWSTRMFFQDRVGSDHNYVLHSDVEGSEYGLRVDAARHANSADAMSDPLIGTYTDLGPYPQWDTKETLSGVTLQATLDQAAQGIVQLRGEPFAIPSFTVAGPTPPPSDLRLGDSAIFHITQSAVTFNGRARVGGITWKVTEGQPEKRVLALVPFGPASQTVLNQTIEDRCVSCR